ncbi:MAG: hypothetical protein HY544_03570 [Candidatus Diapherotrites archaeon]|uniref:Uncharacterized protein n=1 Tax=Candidatus Iainarchaeum sp. TaxID=3101447 RepID=A0A8T3YMN6_9ARCH|nr:hypothetical protein [Candidatus Diapherotrites archaeon]
MPFECESNTCSTDVCMNLQKQFREQGNIARQILDWLSGIFGFAAK